MKMFRRVTFACAARGGIPFKPELSRKIKIDGGIVSTLEQAAYALRQYSLLHGDIDAWRLARMLREADNPLQVRLAEAKLNRWLYLRPSKAGSPP